MEITSRRPLLDGPDSTKKCKFTVCLFAAEDAFASLFQTRFFYSTCKGRGLAACTKAWVQQRDLQMQSSDLCCSPHPCLQTPFSPQELKQESMRKLGKPGGRWPCPTSTEGGSSHQSDGAAAGMERKRNCCAQQISNVGNSSLQVMVWTSTPHMVWETDELMEETEYKVTTSGSESLSQVPAGWEQV